VLRRRARGAPPAPARHRNRLAPDPDRYLRVGGGLQRRSEPREQPRALRRVVGWKPGQRFLDQRDEHAIRRPERERDAVGDRRAREQPHVAKRSCELRGTQARCLAHARLPAVDLRGTECDRELVRERDIVRIRRGSGA
jgi:hypothetical protein